MPGSARASAAKTTPSSRENIAIGILLENCVGCRKRQSRVNGREQIRNKKRDGQLAIGFCLLPIALVYCLLRTPSCILPVCAPWFSESRKPASQSVMHLWVVSAWDFLCCLASAGPTTKLQPTTWSRRCSG